ncbi:MAG: tetratricopeptide repeat protein [Lachnospiraceae bacterium]|nr:tetratricopeptide repeat protein [Lachnospiraceae bacterium]
MFKKFAGLIGLLVFTMVLTTGCGNNFANKNFKKGREYAEKGLYTKSITYYEKAIKSGAKRSDYYIGYGNALVGAGRYVDANKAFEKAVSDVDNSVSKSYKKQAYYGQAISYYYMGDYSNAEKFCEKAMELSAPASLDEKISLTRAASLSMLSKDKEAERVYGEFIKKYPENAEAHFEYAALLIKKEKYEEAANELNEAISYDKEKFDAYFELYDTYIKLKDTRSAEKVFDKLFKLDKDSGEVYFYMGKAYYILKQTDKADYYFKKAKKEGYDKTSLYQGLIYMDDGDYNKAVKYLKEGLSEKYEVDNAIIYEKLYECYQKMADFKHAAYYLEKAIEYGGESSERLKELTIVYEKAKNFEKAKTSAKRYIELYPNDTDMNKELRFIESKLSQ